MKNSKIEKEITEYQSVIDDPNIPADEKEFAKSEIEELKKKMKGSDIKVLTTKSQKKKNEKYINKKLSAHVKSQTKASAHNCADLIKQARERKANAKKRASLPKKTEATKIKETIIKVEKKVENKFDAMSRADITKLIAETRSLLKQLEKALKKH